MADWEEIKKHLEPIGDNFYSTPYTDIQISIAISLKRIADNMDKLTHPPIMVSSDVDYEELLKSNGYIVNKP